MYTVFNPNNPVLRFNSNFLYDDMYGQERMMFRYADVASILKPERDPKFEVSDRKKALGWLTVINSLAQALNNAVCIKRSVDIGGAHKLIALKVNNGAT